MPLLLLVAALAFAAWALDVPAPEGPALVALTPSAQVDVRLGPPLTFRPTGQEPTTGLILYPGGRVDPRAYAPAARAIAEAGYLVVLVPMPLNLALFGIDRADAVIADHPEIERWAIGGHSLGGSMAAQYAHAHPATIQGLVLWASYPADSLSLADRALEVTSIYGTRDGLATAAQVEASRPRLPPTAQFVAIPGGNHAQFGWYGRQDGDNPASLSQDAQQTAIVEATLALLARLER